MADPPPDTVPRPGGDLVTVGAGLPAHAGDPGLSAAAQAALGRKAAAPATLCAYKRVVRDTCEK